MNTTYLESIKKQFEYYKMLGDTTIKQLPDYTLFWQYNTESNSIAIIVKHLSGNMLSRWTDFLTSDGEKEWRHRDAEFENEDNTKEEIIQKWNDGWHCFFSAINSLKEEDLAKIIYIRNEGHTVLEAINRQLAHYPYHIGQMVFIGKMICNEKWTSLSIPRGKSNTYNAEKFIKEKKQQHFTDEFLKKPVILNKTEIIKHLNVAHAAFWNTAAQLPNTTISRNNKWSVCQNVEHIHITLSRVGNYLMQPKAFIATQFGISERESVSYEELINNYGIALAAGIKATAPFIPEENPNETVHALINKGEILLKELIANMQDWSEEDLDHHNCPHPALGIITVREMLYFTIYHVQHHEEIIKKNAIK